MMYYRISKNEKNLFFGKKIAQVWAVTLSHILPYAFLACLRTCVCTTEGDIIDRHEIVSLALNMQLTDKLIS